MIIGRDKDSGSSEETGNGKKDPIYGNDDAHSTKPIYDYTVVGIKRRGLEVRGSEERNIGEEEILLEVRKTITRMNILFNAVYNRRASVEFLYHKGLELKSRLEEEVVDFLESERFEDLRDAFEFVEDLHDKDAREYHQENPEQIYYHSRRLSQY